ncbi:jg17153 [Pararge aegeria aegeria]|uniref:Jg17153 protein n=1 Tax=Pararge aegeria aegeria TaxID=348720 RepID=A0A8S4RKN6_9NEOP|nr:jg17153 [Pararge aegeria aegeria]
MLLVIILTSWFILVRDWQECNIPGPLPLPLLGFAHNLIMIKPSGFLPLLHRFKMEYGDAFRVHLFHNPYVILSHPKYVEPLVSHSELITKGRSYSFLRPWLGDGLLTSTESIMGVSIEAQTNSESEYVKAIETVAKIVSLRMRNPFAGEETIFRLLRHKKAQDEALGVLHSQTQKVIKMRREELKNVNKSGVNEQSDNGIKNKHDFLDLLLLSTIDGKKIDDQHVREEVDTFMFEGHDTTTSGISFTLYCLAKHPEMQEKILEEQRRILGQNLDRDPSYVDLKEMKYLELVIKESLRMYPSVPLIERLMVKDTEIAGLKLRKGTSVLVNIMEMHRHPELYDNPFEFRPERHDTASANSAKNAFSWLAFSAGPRNCIGQKFAMMELKITVASVIKNFTVLPVDVEEPGLCAELILRSEVGVNIKLKPRNKTC